MPSRKSKSFKPFTKKLLAQFSLGIFIFAGFLSAMFLSTESQDLRNQAMVEDGIVEIRPSYSPSNGVITAGSAGQLNLQINTHEVPIIGVQLILQVESNADLTLSQNSLVIPSESGLDAIYSNVVSLDGGGYEVQLSLKPRGPVSSTARFSNNSFQTIAQLNLNPQAAGSINFVYDVEMSYVLDGDSADVMKTATGFNMTVVEKTTPTTQPTTTPRATRTPGDPSPTRAPQATSTPRPNITKSPAPTRAPWVTRKPPQRPPFFYPRSKYRRKIWRYLQRNDIDRDDVRDWFRNRDR
jgi:hypothetical protein